MTSRAAIYVRVSTEEQARNGTSIDTQLARCREHVGAQGWELVDEFADEGVSGAKESRPALDRMLADARSGGFDVVVVAALDRFSRDLRNQLNLLYELQQHRVELVDLEYPNDSTFIRHIRGAVAQEERDKIRERTMAGLRATAAKGLWPGGPPPYGLALERVEGSEHNRLTVDPHEAGVLDTAARMIVEDGISTWEAAQRLNGLGLLPRNAPKWKGGNLRRVLRTAAAFNDERYYAKPSARYQASGEPIQVAAPRVLDPKLARALGTLVEVKRQTQTPQRRFYPLTGHLSGVCGGAFSGAYRVDRGYRFYRCRNARTEAEPRCDDRMIRAEEVERAVWGAVTEMLAEPERLLALASDYLGLSDAREQTHAEQISQVDARIAQVDEALRDRLAEYAKAGLPAAAVRAAAASLESERRALERHRAQLERWRIDSAAEQDRVERLRELAQQATERLASMDERERAAVLDLLEVRVTVVGYHPLRLRVEGLLSDDGGMPDEDWVPTGRGPGAPHPQLGNAVAGDAEVKIAWTQA